jgi:hypothetical protein
MEVHLLASFYGALQIVENFDGLLDSLFQTCIWWGSIKDEKYRWDTDLLGKLNFKIVGYEHECDKEEEEGKLYFYFLSYQIKLSTKDK